MATLGITGFSDVRNPSRELAKLRRGLWNLQILQLVSKVCGLVNCSLTLYRAL